MAFRGVLVCTPHTTEREKRGREKTVMRFEKRHAAGFVGVRGEKDHIAWKQRLKYDVRDTSERRGSKVKNHGNDATRDDDDDAESHSSCRRRSARSYVCLPWVFFS